MLTVPILDPSTLSFLALSTSLRISIAGEQRFTPETEWLVLFDYFSQHSLLFWEHWFNVQVPILLTELIFNIVKTIKLIIKFYYLCVDNTGSFTTTDKSTGDKVSQVRTVTIG